MYINLRVKPNSKQDSVKSITPDEIQITVQEEARDGEANTAVCHYIASLLDLRKWQVEICKGHKS